LYYFFIGRENLLFTFMGRIFNIFISLFLVFSFLLIPNFAWSEDDGGMYGKLEMESETAVKGDKSEVATIKESNEEVQKREAGNKGLSGEKVKKSDSLLGGLIQLTTAILVTVGGDSTSTKTNADVQ